MNVIRVPSSRKFILTYFYLLILIYELHAMVYAATAGILLLLFIVEVVYYGIYHKYLDMWYTIWYILIHLLTNEEAVTGQQMAEIHY